MIDPCPRCKKYGLVIQQSDDSNYKEVRCYCCDYHGWLKNLKSNLITK
jgi:hypothetical protein